VINLLGWMHPNSVRASADLESGKQSSVDVTILTGTLEHMSCGAVKRHLSKVGELNVNLLK
jgi:hypothetical protein